MIGLHLLIVPEPDDPESVSADTEDLAWNHAMSLTVIGIDFGSDHFVEIHRELLDKYNKCGVHLGYIQYMSMLTLQQLLATDMLDMRVPDGEEPAAALVSSIKELTSIIASGIIHVHASESVNWINNQEWEHMDSQAKSVPFYFQIESGELDE
jgi:hypothetical protein